jgi:hypothetical protein
MTVKIRSFAVRTVEAEFCKLVSADDMKVMNGQDHFCRFEIICQRIEYTNILKQLVSDDMSNRQIRQRSDFVIKIKSETIFTIFSVCTLASNIISIYLIL